MKIKKKREREKENKEEDSLILTFRYWYQEIKHRESDPERKSGQEE